MTGSFLKKFQQCFCAIPHAFYTRSCGRFQKQTQNAGKAHKYAQNRHKKIIFPTLLFENPDAIIGFAAEKKNGDFHCHR